MAKTKATCMQQPALQKTATKKTAKRTGHGEPATSKPQASQAGAATATQAPPRAPPALAPKCVIILRGLPGSGKSTRAEQLAAAASAAGHSAAIQFTDSFFTDLRTGEYSKFDFGMLLRNHERNFDAFCSSLLNNVHTVIVDNKNILRQYYERYQDEAEEQGYVVKIEVVGEFSRSAAALYAARSVHGVPYEKVMQMLAQWKEEEEDAGCCDGYDSEDEFESEDEYSDDY